MEVAECGGGREEGESKKGFTPLLSYCKRLVIMQPLNYFVGGISCKLVRDMAKFG